jgi:hypothetical protein
MHCPEFLEELFAFNLEQDNPLNYTVIAQQQVSDQHLQKALTKPMPKYTQAEREGVLLYTHHADNKI